MNHRISAPVVDEVLWLALTVWAEAQGEPWEGQLAVAHVIVTRARARGQSIPDVVLQSWQFSAWNTDSPVRMRFDDIRPDDPAWVACYRAAFAALHGLAPDPTGGADHYLNPSVLPRLPRWWDPAKEVGKIGKHVFAKLEE